jgi:hypothetical protein
MRGALTVGVAERRQRRYRLALGVDRLAPAAPSRDRVLAGSPSPDGHIRQIAEYCESDVLNSKRNSLRINTIELAGLDQRGDGSPVGGALVAAGEQRVLAGIPAAWARPRAS